MEQHALLKIWLDFIAGLAWPALVLALILVFRIQLRNLFIRLKSGEIAGAKFDFNEVAAGYIRSSIDELASASDPNDRADIAGRIKGLASVLGGVHPIAIGYLINAVGGPGHRWVDMSNEQHFTELERLGLATIHRMTDDGKPAITLVFTPKGAELMKSIGFTAAEIEKANEYAKM